jgi:hypothetical protein
VADLWIDNDAFVHDFALQEYSTQCSDRSNACIGLTSNTAMCLKCFGTQRATDPEKTEAEVVRTPKRAFITRAATRCNCVTRSLPEVTAIHFSELLIVLLI